jgi:hypothetical protein
MEVTDISFPVESGSDSGPIILKNSHSPGCIFVGMLFLNLFWNGIVIGFSYNVYFVQKPGGILPYIMMIPFQAIGLGIIGVTIYCFLAMFNPRPTLVCSQQYMYPGQEFELSWLFEKSAGRIQELFVFIEGTEQVSYRQGTSNRTESHVFFRHQVVQTSSVDEITQGMRLVTLPSNVMHTFTTSNNKIIWQVRFHGVIARWPDVRESFTIDVYPPVVSDAFPVEASIV